MLKYILVFALGVQFASTFAQSPQNWTHFVRTAGHGLNKGNIEATIKDAQETFLFGIEVDNDIPGRYSSFLDPAEKLADIKRIAERAHEINNHAFVYVAGLECITENADTAKHSFFRDHPDWVQRDINNRPAKFGGGDAFWIDKGDEDVWISPYAKEWREKYMEHIRAIAATGIDGIWVDIPYWMTHFDGWENSWASFDDYTVEAFRNKTGLDARKDLKLGDSNDANFRKWIDFRIETLTNFMEDITNNVKSVNPDCKVIPEIYPGIGEEAVRVGSDVYELYKVVDVVAHEFSGSGGNASSKNPHDWFDRMIGMYTFRAFAGDKASWMLSYSWGQENKVQPAEPMKNLALSNLMAGTNHYDARGHVMSGSNDIETRKLINKWIAANENTFYKPRQPISPIGIYFSPQTRNYFPVTFMESYEGIMSLMLQAHLEFQIVTPRTLKDFKGNLLILPGVKYASAEELAIFEKFSVSGKGLVITGESDLKLPKAVLSYPQCPGKAYSQKLKNEFDGAAWTNTWQKTDFFLLLSKFKNDLLAKDKSASGITIKASPFVSTQIASVEGKPHIFLANFSGLKSDDVVNQIPQKDIRITFKAELGAKVFFLPFLGVKQQLETKFENNQMACTLPPVEKGGVVWIETKALHMATGGFSNKVIAHRGAFKNTGVPENSIASLRAAIQMGCGGSEFDIHMTVDSVLVINHDHTLQGLSIETSTYAALLEKTLSNGEKIPTLESYLSAGNGQTATKLVAEIKPSMISKERSLALAGKVVEMVKKLRADPQVVYISFDYDVLKKVKQLDAKAPLQYLNGDVSATQLRNDGIDADYHYSIYQKDPDWIKNAKKIGVITNVWTVNDPATMDSLLSQQIDFITTNEPELLLKKLKQ